MESISQVKNSIKQNMKVVIEFTVFLLKSLCSTRICHKMLFLLYLGSDDLVVL